MTDKAGKDESCTVHMNTALLSTTEFDIVVSIPNQVSSALYIRFSLFFNFSPFFCKSNDSFRPVHGRPELSMSKVSGVCSFPCVSVDFQQEPFCKHQGPHACFKMRPDISIRGCVRLSVRRSVGNTFFSVSQLWEKMARKTV